MNDQPKADEIMSFLQKVLADAFKKARPVTVGDFVAQKPIEIELSYDPELVKELLS